VSLERGEVHASHTSIEDGTPPGRPTGRPPRLSATGHAFDRHETAGHTAPDQDLFMPLLAMLPIVRSFAPAQARESRPRPSACAVALLVASAVSLPARAEDIDVYRAQLAAQQKPNVLFVLDFSGSMLSDVNGDDAATSGLERKIDILRSSLANVLDANVGGLRAGIGSIYSDRASGVRWPISEIDADGHDIDPAIPAGAFTARDIMLKQLDRQQADGSTRTVNALAEAALYFRGATVGNGGRPPNQPNSHRPDRWNAALERYNGGHPSAAIEASYAERNESWTPGAAYWQAAYQEGVNEAGNVGFCFDYSASGGANGCADKIIVDPAADCQSRDGRYQQSDDPDGGGRAHRLCSYDHPDAWRGASYRTPIEGECSANVIVLISDGVPDRYDDNDALREVLGTDDPDASCVPLAADFFAGSRPDANGDCGPELVRKLATEPQVAGIENSTVKTFTIGFGVEGAGQDYLDLLASEGGGSSYSADSAATLADALTQAAGAIVGEAESFVELAIDVDKASFSHGDRAYFSLFTPSSRRGWSGNLKGYFLDDDGFSDINGEPAVVAGPSGPRFADTAQSFWSDAPDGNDVAKGGASEQLVAGGRTLYTFPGGTPSGAGLSQSAANALVPGNGAITAAMLGTDEATRTAALTWLQTAPMGDPLHSKSVSVEYGPGGGGGGNRQVVYVMTNQGFLHAIDATAPSGPGAGDTAGGGELFAFMPKRLLANLPALASGKTGDDHVYGLDGGTTRWHDDTNANGVVDAGETMLLIVGMRRGGEAYYAIDVSDPTDPALAWQIDSTMTGFAELAQSWSRPMLVRVRQGTGSRRVLMFGGGYDPILDDEDARVPSRGNAVFVVDQNGSLVKKFTHPGMRYAMPADLAVIDSDSDGLADRVYAVDLGEQVWRVDFDDLSPTSTAAVTLFADLSGGAYQPFFHAPSIALNRGTAGNYFSVALGSGDRTDPLATASQNALFMLRDTDVAPGAPAAAFASILSTDLLDATDDALGSSDPAVASAAQAAFADKRGWRVNLETGEKSLSRIVSFSGELFATTFRPDPASADDPCSFGSDQRYYRMDLGTAVPRILDEDDGASLVEREARWRRIEGSGIPSEPVPIFTKGSDTTKISIGQKLVDSVEPRMTRVYWHAK